MNFQGVIIEESLADTSVLSDVRIISTKIETATGHHKTPWVKQWTLHTVDVNQERAEALAEKLSQALEKKHPWYADYKTEKEHYIIYSNKVFHVTDRADKNQYEVAKQYGISLGIPEYQVDFAPTDKVWAR